MHVSKQERKGELGVTVCLSKYLTNLLNLFNFIEIGKDRKGTSGKSKSTAKTDATSKQGKNSYACSSLRCMCIRPSRLQLSCHLFLFLLMGRKGKGPYLGSRVRV